MLENVEDSRSFLKRIKSTGWMIEPWGTPELIEYGLERRLSTLMVIDPSERRLPINLTRVVRRRPASAVLREDLGFRNDRGPLTDCMYMH